MAFYIGLYKSSDDGRKQTQNIIIIIIIIIITGWRKREFTTTFGSAFRLSFGGHNYLFHQITSFSLERPSFSLIVSFLSPAWTEKNLKNKNLLLLSLLFNSFYLICVFLRMEKKMFSLALRKIRKNADSVCFCNYPCIYCIY
jgi:hypothetical protein